MSLRKNSCITLILAILLIFVTNFKIGHAQTLSQPMIGTITGINAGTERIIEMLQEDETSKDEHKSAETEGDNPGITTESNEIEIFYPPSEPQINSNYSDKNQDIETFNETTTDKIEIEQIKNNCDLEKQQIDKKINHTKIITAVSGGVLKVDTDNGGEIKNKISGADIGFVRELKTSSGKLLVGGIVDYNHNSYDSDFKDVDGKGNSNALTVGVIAKQSRHDGVYYEGSIRLGRAKTSLDADNLQINRNKFDIHYEKSAPVYAGHAKLGKIIKLNEKETADIYGIYAFSHQDHMNFELPDSENCRLSSIDSNRLKVGCRMTTKVKNGKIYYGLSYQYEAKASVKARHNDVEISSADGKGSSGVLELGYKLSAGKDNTVNVDLNASGFVGQQKGFIFQAQLLKSI